MKFNWQTLLIALISALAVNSIHITSADAAVASLNLLPSLIGQVVSPEDSAQTRMTVYLVYLCIVLGGLLGGFIFSISRNRGFVIPGRYEIHDGETKILKIGLGTIADMLIGLGGGILIFMIVPYVGDQDLITNVINVKEEGEQTSYLLKIIALALIGGFAGISLFDEAAKRLTEQVRDLEFTVSKNRKELTEISAIPTQEAEIQYLLNPLLDPTISPLKPEQKQELIQKVVAAPINTRNWVFSRAQEALSKHWLMGEKGNQLSKAEIRANHELLKQLILPFKALVQAAEREQNQGKLDRYLHRYLAHIAFCQQQIAVAETSLRNGESSENWMLAEENLTRAIEVREKNPETIEHLENSGRRRDEGDPNQLFWHYELYRSLSYFKLSDTKRAEEEITKIQPIWKNKEPGVLAGLLKDLDTEFLQWLEPMFSSPQSSELLSELTHSQDTNGVGHFGRDQEGSRNGRRRDADRAAGDFLENLNS